ncbi:MAG: hypothetical protein ACI4U2_03525, partial [Christensenellaceae bacterium]
MKRIVLLAAVAMIFLVGCGTMDPDTTHTHQYRNSLLIAPTCTEEGVLLRECDCGDCYTESIPATGHKAIVQSGIAPTCTESGVTDEVICEVCHLVLQPGEVLSPLGHEYQDDACIRCHLPMCVWDGTKDVSWYSEDRTSFVIDSPAELAGLASLVEEGNTFAGKVIELSGDIRLGDSDDSDMWEYIAPSTVWSPIGSESHPFCGTFNGNGHVIDGVYGSSVFGFVKDGTVANFTLKRSCLKGENYVGIVGRAQDSAIVNVVNESGSVNASGYYAGGIVGYLDYGKIVRCENHASVTGYANGTGGIAGYASGSVELSVNDGCIMGADQKVGGIVGYLYYGSVSG